MTDTDRNQLVPSNKQEFLYEEEFIDRFFLGCFSHTVYVVIKQRTLYLYNSKDCYLEKPGEPNMFFNLNYSNCTLDDDFVEISNHFSKVILRHTSLAKIAELLDAINRGRVSVGAQDLYPRKFVCLSSQDFRQDRLPWTTNS